MGAQKNRLTEKVLLSTHNMIMLWLRNKKIISVLIAFAKMPLINAHTDVFSKIRGLNSGLSHHLHLYFVYVCEQCMFKRVCAYL